ncbi:hypothetical protein RDWZM_004299 [Blomia tropicalis]|uniref:Cytochrome b561 domain-containing protein n=1 Tax=Blomia tropicalis TaxID=40697 RepID=A0A9Q0MHS8_BLOTA|nr:hypothetical protein RDWZM_004299 [Blomia tropicalis]
MSSSNNSNNANPTIIGISHQPYRSYLTDRNHFYHSASVANPTAQLSSITTSAGGNSLHYSSSQQPQQQQQNSQPLLQTQLSNKSNTSPTSGTNQLTNSRTSLNSNSSNHHHHHQHQHNRNAMMKTKRSSTTSSTLPIGSDGYPSKTPESDDEDEPLYPQSSACSRCIFGFLWCVAQIGLWASVIMLVYWMLKFDRGFAFQNDKRKMFNLHAFLMLTGFIFVNGQSMLIYKTYMCCKKIYNKICHAIFFVLSISLVSFGMLVGIQAQHMVTSTDETPVHFYSLHSWIGLVTCGLFALQFFFGFITFLVLLCCERGTANYRQRFLPVHVTFGMIIFLLATATCLSGLLQTARSRLSGPTSTDLDKPDYKDVFVIRDNNPFTNSGLVLNGCGACLILLAILIPYLVRNFNFNRRYEAASFRVNH